jgi:hypothetical protein
MSKYQMSQTYLFLFDIYISFDRNVPRKPRLVGVVKGHNMNEISSSGSPALGGELHIWVLTFDIALI